MNTIELEKEKKEISIKNTKTYHFENNYGKIEGNKIYFKSTNQELIINDIAHIKIIYFKDTVPNIILFILSVLSITPIIIFSINNKALYIVLSIVFFSGTLFTIKKNYSVQIVLTIAKQVFIPINKKNINEASDLIKNLIDYKEANPKLMVPL